MDRAQEDDDEKFVNKIRSLKHVAIDLTNVIKSQNKSIQDLEPGFSATFYRLRSHLVQLDRIDPRQFRIWLFYFLTSIFFMFVLFIFYFVF